MVDVREEATMSRWLAGVAAWAIRVVRGLWPDRNPLRRTVDRVEGVVAGALAVAFLAGVPLAAVAAWHAAYRYGAHAAHVQQSARRQVPAVVLATAPTFGYSGDESMVQARWTAPDGTRHTGEVLAPLGTGAGGMVRVWTDAAGRPAGPPLQPLQVKNQATLAAILAPVLLGEVLLAAGQLAHYLLGRRRLAAWEAEWRAIGPQWSRR
jgi:hypothetical protein